MDKIIMKNLLFYGYHGALPEEQKIGQKFVVDAELYLPLDKAGMSDDLNETVDYGAVYNVIREIMTNSRFKLIEALAEHICTNVFAVSPLIRKVVLTIKKPEAPIEGIFDYFGVTIERVRQ